MKFRERLAQLNRLQRSFMFKVIATAIIVLAAIGTGVSYRVSQAAAPVVDSAEALRPVEPPKDAQISKEQQEELKYARERYETAKIIQQTLNDILRRKEDPTAVYLGLGAVSLMAIGVVWLGLGLTMLALGSVVAMFYFPLDRIGRIRGDDGRGMQDFAKFIVSLGALSFSFFVLMEFLRLSLSSSSSVTAIARNVVNEAVRIKVSLVFIVLLMFGLAALPGLLDEANPLRYRVQAFLQYGTGGSFWLIALLVLFLAVGSVAFEQRDRVIWQTMTKPVACWQYILGKWLGVVGVAAVLLAVSSTGVFLFTEYLRNQRANNEVAPYVARGQEISEDRLVLETQVLAARTIVGFRMPRLEAADERKAVDARLDQIRQADPGVSDTPEVRAQLAESINSDFRREYLTIPEGSVRRFEFHGLEDVQRLNKPMTLRYRVSIGADDPRESARLTLGMLNTQPRVQEVPLGQTMTIPVSAASVENGMLAVEIVNGDMYRRMDGDPEWANNGSMTIEPDGLQVFYPVSSYRVNFFRVVFVLWLKLALLAMVAICAATFLSFSVASLVAFGTFLVLESGSFLATSLEYFDAADAKGNLTIWKAIVRAIAVPISWVAEPYAKLRPTANLVDGQLVSWSMLIAVTIVLVVLIAIIYALATFIFKNRELATYSGQ